MDVDHGDRAAVRELQAPAGHARAAPTVGHPRAEQALGTRRPLTALEPGPVGPHGHALVRTLGVAGQLVGVTQDLREDVALGLGAAQAKPGHAASGTSSQVCAGKTSWKAISSGRSASTQSATASTAASQARPLP